MFQKLKASTSLPGQKGNMLHKFKVSTSRTASATAIISQDDSHALTKTSLAAWKEGLASLSETLESNHAGWTAVLTSFSTLQTSIDSTFDRSDKIIRDVVSVLSDPRNAEGAAAEPLRRMAASRKELRDVLAQIAAAEKLQTERLQAARDFVYYQNKTHNLQANGKDSDKVLRNQGKGADLAAELNASTRQLFALMQSIEAERMGIADRAVGAMLALQTFFFGRRPAATAAEKALKFCVGNRSIPRDDFTNWEANQPPDVSNTSLNGDLSNTAKSFHTAPQPFSSQPQPYSPQAAQSGFFPEQYSHTKCASEGLNQTQHLSAGGSYSQKHENQSGSASESQDRLYHFSGGRHTPPLCHHSQASSGSSSGPFVPQRTPPMGNTSSAESSLRPQSGFVHASNFSQGQSDLSPPPSGEPARTSTYDLYQKFPPPSTFLSDSFTSPTVHGATSSTDNLSNLTAQMNLGSLRKTNLQSTGSGSVRQSSQYHSPAPLAPNESSQLMYQRGRPMHAQPDSNYSFQNSDAESLGPGFSAPATPPLGRSGRTDGQMPSTTSDRKWAPERYSGASMPSEGGYSPMYKPVENGRAINGGDPSSLEPSAPPAEESEASLRPFEFADRPPPPPPPAFDPYSSLPPG